MLFEQVRPADVRPKHVDRLMPRHLDHLQHAGARLGARCQEASPEAVPGEQRRIEASALGVCLHQRSRGMPGQRLILDASTLQDGPEDKPLGDPGRGKPCLDGGDRRMRTPRKIAISWPMPS